MPIDPQRADLKPLTPLRRITKAEAVLRDGFYWVVFEFDDGSKWKAPAGSKLQALFQTRNRIGDVVLLDGTPWLRPNAKRRPARNGPRFTQAPLASHLDPSHGPSDAEAALRKLLAILDDQKQ